ncbi:MAG TPA: hypothetical protein VLA85_15665 [Verrucomicrobiae bacterium]|nr:hypothetical protein [Verrucomicrobiae bacterium]
MMRSLRFALALLLAAGLAGCAYGGGGSPYGYQQANAYPDYGYSAGPSIGLGFGSYGGYPSYYYPNYPNYPNWHHQGNWHRPPPGGYPGNGHKPPPGDGHGWPPPNAGGGNSLKPPVFGGKPANDGNVVAGGNRRPLRPHTTNPLCKDCNS